MARKNGGWFSKVRKAIGNRFKDNKAERTNKSKMKSIIQTPDPVPGPSNPPRVPPLEEVKLIEVENERTNHAYPVATTTTDGAAASYQFATFTQPSGKSKAEVAVVRMQAAFRGYLARRAFKGLRGLVRLKAFVDGPIVKRQTLNTLKCMQALSHVQSQIQSRRSRILEENRVLQRQLLQKQAKEMESFRIGEEWDDSLRSKEKIEENLLHKYEAAMKRERALAYSYTHQQTWKKSTKQTNLLFMDPINPQWGWSWLERWMASQPGETRIKMSENDELTTNGGEITKSFARYQLNSENSPATPSSKMASLKIKSGSSKQKSLKSHDDDSRSSFSVQSNRNRRHSIAGSSIGDDESLASSPSIPSYMAPTRSAKAKLSLGTDNGTPSSAKKRLSFPPSPARSRRLSTPRRVEAESLAAN